MTAPHVLPVAEPSPRCTRSSQNRHRSLTRMATVVGLSVMTVGIGSGISNAQPSPVSATAAQPAPRSVSDGPSLWHEPRITFVDQPTTKAQDIIVWAVGRYRDAGLQLPDLRISFPVICSGKGALYHVGKRSIDFCRINKDRALHEFAHAWDDTSGAVDRAAFLELRGLKVWWGGTEMPSAEQGAEQVADIIAWGLMGCETRNVPQIPNNSVSELTRVFAMLTGEPCAAKPTAATDRSCCPFRGRGSHTHRV